MNVSNSHSNDATSLHEAIKKGDFNSVESLLSSLITKFPVDKNFFDVNNDSAAVVAIRWKRDEIYELLLSKGIFLGPHEWMDEAISGQDDSQKNTLRDIHRRYLIDPSLKHLINLITSTKFSPDASPSASDRREYLRLITEAFEDLNNFKSIEPILKVASTSQKLKIAFDFNRDSVEFLDPKYDRNVLGVCYTKYGIICIGAKNLKEKNNRCEVLGHLIHELTHFVMELVYGNGAKPYQRENQKKIDDFSEVVDITAAKKESEPYIKIVYDYPDIHHHAELIVRVPHLTALYKDDADKTIEVQKEFSELFDFYEENTLVDLTLEFPLLEVKHEIRELNELCGTLSILEESDIEMSSQALDGFDLNSLSNDKILFISSNCPQLTLNAIFQQVRNEINLVTSLIFADLKSMKNAKIFDLTAKALALSTHPSLIIICNNVVKLDAVMTIFEKLNKKDINQKVIFILNKCFETSGDANVFEVVHSWNHLTSNFQQKLLQKKVQFQRTEMVFKDLLNDFSAIESIPFQDLLDDQTIVIGKSHELETEKLIEIKFLTSNSKKVRDSEDYTIEHDLDELLTLAKEHKTILISDEPGMGKSTSLKMLHSKLRQKNPSLWLVFMDLKEYFEAYEISCLIVNEREDIAKFLTENILKIKSFEAQVFTQLFNEDRVVLLMDGLDEICPSYKQFIFSLMKDIQKFSKNQLWISTRSHLLKELKQELNPIVFTLKPFTKENRREFFEKHFSEDQNSESKLKEIESFLGNLNPRNTYYGQIRDVCNPLVLKMIVEILCEDQNLKLSDANLFVIYDRFTRKMIEKCNKEKGPEAKTDIENSFGNSNIVEFYQQQAFLTCFGDHDIIEYKDERYYYAMWKKLIVPQFDNVCIPPLDEIVRVGLMYASSFENLHFIHRTFAEYYVAKFFFEVIFNFTNQRPEEYLNNTIEFLLKEVLGNYQFKHEFITILLENVLNSVKRRTIKKFPSSTLKLVQKEMVSRNLSLLVKDGSYNLIEFFVMHLHPDGQNLLFTNFDYKYSLENYNLIMIAAEYQSMDFIKRFFTLLNNLNADKFKNMFFEQEICRDNEQKIENRNVFSFAASNGNSEVFKFIVEYCESLMTKEELNKLLMQRGNSHKTILHSAVKSDRKVDIIIEVLTQKLSSSQQKFLLEESTELTVDGCITGLQFNAGMSNSVANFESLLVFMRKVLNLKDIENFLLHQNGKGFRAFEIALTNNNGLVFDMMKNFYLEVFGGDKMRKIIFNQNNGENWILKESSLYFMRICSYGYKLYYYDGAFKRFLTFVMELFAVDRIQKEFFLAKDEVGVLFFNFAVIELGTEDFAYLFSLIETNLETNDRMEILQQKNFRGECAFHWAVQRKNLSNFQKFRHVYKESFDEHILRCMIVGSDKNWMLSVIEINHNENSETFAELCHYLKELFKDTDETEVLKEFFLFADGLGQTAFMAAAKGKNKDFEHLFALTKELYKIETVKEFLLLEDKNGDTAFTYSFTKILDTTFEFVKSAFEELFDRKQMQKIVLVERKFIGNILNCCLSFPSSLIFFEVLCNFLIKLFKDKAQKLKHIFASVDYLDQTVLMIAANKSNENYFKVLANVIEKLLVKKEIVEMLCQKNQRGMTAFHFSIVNEKEDIFETVVDFYIKTLGNKAMKEIILAEVDWTKVFEVFPLVSGIERLVPLLKSMSEEVGNYVKNIFLKSYSQRRTIKEEMERTDKHLNGSIISYLKEQFHDEQMKILIMELESTVF